MSKAHPVPGRRVIAASPSSPGTSGSPSRGCHIHGVHTPQGRSALSSAGRGGGGPALPRAQPGGDLGRGLALPSCKIEKSRCRMRCSRICRAGLGGLSLPGAGPHRVHSLLASSGASQEAVAPLLQPTGHPPIPCDHLTSGAKGSPTPPLSRLGPARSSGVSGRREGPGMGSDRHPPPCHLGGAGPPRHRPFVPLANQPPP